MAYGSLGAARQRIAVVGAGVAGLSAAWLLSQRHDVTLFDQNGYLGGHSNTVEVAGERGPVAVDTGFIVYNALNYPNLVRLFQHLDVATEASDMSFAVSLRGGELEYAGTDLGGLFAQASNLVRPRFWRMLRDLHRFYRNAQSYRAEAARDRLSIGQLLDRHAYSAAFRDDHLMPMAGAIWSATDAQMAAYPATAFIDFFANHGLIQYSNRPQWRTVVGGSREYVRRLVAGISGSAQVRARVVAIKRDEDGVRIGLADGRCLSFDYVVIASHADQALALLEQPGADEARLLGAFRYSRNRAVLHRDASLMPVRRAAWQLELPQLAGFTRGDLLDEPPAAAPDPPAALCHPESAARAARDRARVQLRTPPVRPRRARRAARACQFAGQATHVVLRELLRLRFPRGCTRSGTVGRRGAGRRAPPWQLVQPSSRTGLPALEEALA